MAARKEMALGEPGKELWDEGREEGAWPCGPTAAQRQIEAVQPYF